MNIFSRIFLFMAMLLLCACNNNTEQQNVAQDIINAEGNYKLAVVPDFTWPAFQRFWHRAADEHLSLTGFKEAPNGYALDYGMGVTLRIFMQDDLVSGIQVEYIALNDNFSGGLQFKRIVDHMLLVGTFFWKKEIREQLFKHFVIMSQEKKEFVHKRSYFIRSYKKPVWTFNLILVDEGDMVRVSP